MSAPSPAPPAKQSVADVKELESIVYHMTLVESEAVVKFCVGSFSRPGAAEVIRVRSDGIELCRLDTNFHCLVNVSRLPLFATVHSVATVPFPSVSGTSTFADAVAVACDSGTITLLRYEAPIGAAHGEGGDWTSVDSATIGRSGSRVSSAGLFMAVDCRSRALMVAAPMKQKLVLPMVAVEEAGGAEEAGGGGGMVGGGAAAGGSAIRFKSGIDASRPCVVFDCCAVEVPPEQNALFAVLEAELPVGRDDSAASAAASDGSPAVEKFVSFYEFSSSLNTVSRLLSFRVSSTAHALIPVPIDSGPGGILICTDQELIWESLFTRSLSAQQPIPPPPLKVEFPRRSDLALNAPDPMIISHCITKLQRKFFLLVQNELGDLFRVEVSAAGVQLHFRMAGSTRRGDGGSAAPPEQPLTVKYFDTIPPTTSMVLFKRGYLLCASEAASHTLYRVTGDGTTSNTTVKRVKMPTQAAPLASKGATGRATLAAPTRYVTIIQRHFSASTRKPELRNLSVLQTMPNSSETVAMHTSVDAQQRLRFVRLGGRTAQHSAIHTVRYGLPTSPIRSLEFPTTFSVIIPLQESPSLFPSPGEDPTTATLTHNKILLSSSVGTLVITFGDEIQADGATGLLPAVQTVSAATIAEGQGYVQVHTRGIAVIRAEPVHWVHPQQREIIAADCNSNQIVISCDNGGLLAFDLGLTGQQFQVMCTQPTFPNASRVTILPKAYSELCAVSTVASEVHVLVTKTMKSVDVLRAPAPVSSLMLVNLGGSPGRLFLFVGLVDGRLLRMELDALTGKRIAVTAYSCGTLPTTLIRGDGSTYCLVASSEMWRCYLADGAFRISPVLVPASAMTSNATFAAAHRKGLRFHVLLNMSGRTLSISAVHAEDSGSSMYSVTSCALGSVTGRKLLAHPTRPNVYVVMGTEFRGFNPNDVQQQAAAVDKDLPLEVALHERCFNLTPKHVSCLQMFDAVHNAVMPALYLNDGEAAISVGIGSFLNDFGKEPVLVVGCVNQYDHGHGARNPMWSDATLRTYRFATPPLTGPEGALGIQASAMPRLELVHVTIVDHGDMPSAVHVCTTAGILLVGFGPERGLHMYSWGLKHMLWKRKLLDVHRSRILTIETIQDATSSARYTAAGYSAAHAAASASTLILCGLQDQSVMIARYVRQSNGTHFLMAVAVDPLPRFVAAATFIDDRTVAVSDRFGSLVVLRIPSSARFDLPETMEALSDGELIEAVGFRATQSLEVISAFHVGQVVTSLQTVQRPAVAGVTTGPSTVLVYGTVTGKVGALVPFPCEEDAALASYLDPILSEYFHSPVDRSLQKYRSRMNPKLHVIDGDSLHLLAQSKQIFLTTEAKLAVEERVEKFRNVEATHRKLLDLPPRHLISVQELTAKMKAVLGLSE